MNPTKLIKFTVTGFSLALVLTGCGSSSGDDGGTGGSSATGGTKGTGGTATGGVTGTGGTATGGVTGTGGTATGGVTGTGGTATGGVTGTGGGSAGAGGKAGANGAAGGGGHAEGGSAGTAGHPAGGASGSSGAAGSAGGMTLTSPDQADGAAFASMFTCAATGSLGTGINPELDWSGAPATTMSFAITFIDTTQGANKATGQHWAIWDIPASVMQFPKGTTTLSGALAAAMQTNKYLAPCPSTADMYEYTLYALSSATLDVAAGSTGSGTANSAGVANVLTALGKVTPLATAILHGTAPPLYNMH